MSVLSLASTQKEVSSPSSVLIQVSKGVANQVGLVENSRWKRVAVSERDNVDAMG